MSKGQVQGQNNGSSFDGSKSFHLVSQNLVVEYYRQTQTGNYNYVKSPAAVLDLTFSDPKRSNPGYSYLEPVYLKNEQSYSILTQCLMKCLRAYLNLGRSNPARSNVRILTFCTLSNVSNQGETMIPVYILCGNGFPLVCEMPNGMFTVYRSNLSSTVADTFSTARGHI